MSLLVRCDAPGCTAKSDDVGVLWGDEEMSMPAGWREGEEGHYCPAHDCRVADGTYVHNADGLPDDLAYAKIAGFNPVLGTYLLTYSLDEEDDIVSTVSLPRAAVEGAVRWHTASPRWVLVEPALNSPVK